MTRKRPRKEPPGIVTFLIAALASATAHAEALSGEVQAKVRAATFEVVLRKPKPDSLTYEKPLPLDLIPYIQRTDDYLPVGTAFAIGDGRYVSAVHVLAAGMGSQFGAPALRDGASHVYEIDKIVKASLHEDFVVFSLKDDPRAPAFEINPAPTLNETVYAVGNAHGEGVVIRDGLYTSDTPEQQDGRWKWLRFSAAASPGNSGGPLLDSQGRVIGVVLRKSASENLNYAVSIAQVMKSKDNVAAVDTKMHYRLPIMETMETAPMRQEFALPLSFAEFDRTVSGYFEQFADGMQAHLLQKNSARMFPHGDGSAMLLHSVYTAGFPHLIAQKADGTWDVFYPENVADAELPKNGYVSHGTQANSAWARVRRPDDVTAQALYGDSKLYADWLLKAITVQRRVGPESVRVISFGTAREEAIHTDTYGRKWQVQYLADRIQRHHRRLLRSADAGRLRVHAAHGCYAGLDNVRSEMRVLTDFVYISYGGSLGQWREYLAARSLPAERVREDRHRLRVRQAFPLPVEAPGRYAHARPAEDHRGQLPDAELCVLRREWHDRLGRRRHLAHGGRPNERYDVAVSRRPKPAQSMPDSDKSDWDKLAAKQFPYNATPIATTARPRSTACSLPTAPQSASRSRRNGRGHLRGQLRRRGRTGR